MIIALHKNHGWRPAKGRQDLSGRSLRSDDGRGACRNFSFDEMFQSRHRRETKSIRAKQKEHAYRETPERRKQARLDSA
ncbi:MULTISPECIES: hypothetical protein [Caulobacter]|jgi:hypothetical protein|uniref:Uncharacterized protein n=1 Tax=Caulobacter rhizosphaerae TaxID=2010972 RepID=A0ABU1MUC6_9CAUL|nr:MULTISPECIES: hypothetical protein [Caulobacter]MDR6529761.1 hypothetical protein [Caulobacter rhizosphaerae]